jgi:predicted dehydrogenase
MGPVSKVWGQIGAMSHKIESEDLGMAMLAFKNGAMGTILGTTTYVYDSPPRMEIHGEAGAVVTESNRITFWHLKEDNGEAPTSRGPRNVIEDMIGAIRQGRPPKVDGHEGKKSLEIIKAIYKSAEAGKAVELPLKG